MTDKDDLTDSECEMLLCIKYGSLHHAAVAYLKESMDKKTHTFTEQEREIFKPHLATATEEVTAPIMARLEAAKVSWNRQAEQRNKKPKDP